MPARPTGETRIASRLLIGSSARGKLRVTSGPAAVETGSRLPGSAAFSWNEMASLAPMSARDRSNCDDLGPQDPASSLGMTRWQLRTFANWVNGSTPLGLAVARFGSCTVQPATRGLYVASGYTYGFPTGAAFTIGSVVITRHSSHWLQQRPRLLVHEERHASQFALCGGLPLIPCYVLAMAYSRWRTGDRATANVFERRAGLADGGYPPVDRSLPTR